MIDLIWVGPGLGSVLNLSTLRNPSDPFGAHASKVGLEVEAISRH